MNAKSEAFRSFSSRIESYFNLQQNGARFWTLVKQGQRDEDCLLHKLSDILKQHQNEVNVIRTERTTNIAIRLTGKRGKAIVTSLLSFFDPEPLRGTGFDQSRGQSNVAGVGENVRYSEQAVWKDDTGDKSDDQELEAHYMYMAQL
ncbi:hypothetical protein Tco_0054193 [Tanacetum coccineum]